MEDKEIWKQILKNTTETRQRLEALESAAAKPVTGSALFKGIFGEWNSPWGEYDKTSEELTRESIEKRRQMQEARSAEHLADVWDLAQLAEKSTRISDFLDGRPYEDDCRDRVGADLDAPLPPVKSEFERDLDDAVGRFTHAEVEKREQPLREAVSRVLGAGVLRYCEFDTEHSTVTINGAVTLGFGQEQVLNQVNEHFGGFGTRTVLMHEDQPVTSVVELKKVLDAKKASA